MIKFFRKIRQTENLAPTLKGRFSNYVYSHLSADSPLGAGASVGKQINK